jgi:predicted ATPase/class 3 adenylate cyclase
MRLSFATIRIRPFMVRSFLYYTANVALLHSNLLSDGDQFVLQLVSQKVIQTHAPDDGGGLTYVCRLTECGSVTSHVHDVPGGGQVRQGGHMTELFSFGAWVRRRRKALDLTREELAPRLGCSVVTIRRIEADERRPSKQLAARLADSLAIAPEERVAFLKAARGELTVDQLAMPSHSQEHLLGAATIGAGQSSDPVRLPSGTVTFLFTDIEGSTRLWELHTAAMPQALAHHDALLRAAITSNAGVVVKSTGDGVLAAFARAPDALTASLAAQRALQAADWQPLGSLRVRMALHVGTAEWRAGDYFGPPLNRAARLLAAGHGGQILLSRAAAELVQETLPPELTLRDLGEHQLKDLSRPERIFQLIAPDLPAAFAPLSSLSRERTNLPAQLTQLIGREREVAQVGSLLRRPDGRLLTLSGPGGIGKTRLALQVAAELLDHFADGVYFVDLAPISNGALVVGTIAEAIGLKEAAGQPLLESLKRYLHERALLLLLDNFEQVVDAAPAVAELLKAAGALKVLVTSRTILHLSGEHEFSVPPLTLPNPHHVPPLDQLSRYEAVALFVERAKAAKADFQLTIANASAAAKICLRLDGLPLAIELAAARIKLFAPEELLARLELRLPLLTGGPRDMPARQQTLRATIDWSYQLLNHEEQTLFMRLAVFVGGWTLEAAEAVCNAADELGIAIVDGLQSLLDHSLLRQVEGPDGAPRFRRLETIREYALERFAKSGEAAVWQQRHADYFLTLAERAEPELRGVEQTLWLSRLEADYDNLRAALDWAVQRGEVELGARLAGALWRYWEARGLWSEGWARLMELHPDIPADALPHTRIWAKVLQGRAVLAFYLGKHAAARQLFEESLARFRELGHQSGIAWTLIYAGWQVNDGGDPLAARPLLEESLAIFRHLDDRQGMGWALARLGMVHTFLGDRPAARPLVEESLALCRAIGDRWGTAWSLQLLGVVVGYLDDPAAGAALEAESIAISRALGDRRGMAYSQAFLGGFLSLYQGEHAEAQRLIAEALHVQHEIGDHWGIGLVLWFTALLSAAQGQAMRAVRLESASAALIEAIGAALPLAAIPSFTQILQVSRQALTEDEQARAQTEGRAMTIEQAIAYACSDSDGGAVLP